MRDLFGEPQRWGQTLRSMLWTHTSAQLPAFEGDRLISLPVQCSYDFNVAATKYFYALEGGEVPLVLLFSGTVFYRDPDTGALQIDQMPWSKEAACRLPVAALAGDDGSLLPEQRLAASRPRRVRRLLPLQAAGRLHDLGAGAGKPARAPDGDRA